jgi:hypothetical protein
LSLANHAPTNPFRSRLRSYSGKQRIVADVGSYLDRRFEFGVLEHYLCVRPPRRGGWRLSHLSLLPLLRRTDISGRAKMNAILGHLPLPITWSGTTSVLLLTALVVFVSKVLCGPSFPDKAPKVWSGDDWPILAQYDSTLRGMICCGMCKRRQKPEMLAFISERSRSSPSLVIQKRGEHFSKQRTFTLTSGK